MYVDPIFFVMQNIVVSRSKVQSKWKHAILLIHIRVKRVYILYLDLFYVDSNNIFERVVL